MPQVCSPTFLFMNTVLPAPFTGVSLLKGDGYQICRCSSIKNEVKVSLDKWVLSDMRDADLPRYISFIETTDFTSVTRYLTTVIRVSLDVSTSFDRMLFSLGDSPVSQRPVALTCKRPPGGRSGGRKTVTSHKGKFCVCALLGRACLISLRSLRCPPALVTFSRPRYMREACIGAHAFIPFDIPHELYLYM